MKSTTMMPPMSRSRSWRTTSSAASRFFLVTVARGCPDPVNLPVLDVDDGHRSVRSITSGAADGTHLAVHRPWPVVVDAMHRDTSGPLCPSGQRRARICQLETRSGATEFHVLIDRVSSLAPETISPLKSSLNKSRMTLTSTSGSS